MRTTRTLLAALSLVLVAACSTDVSPVSPTGKAVRGAGFGGTGNSVVPDTTDNGFGAGFGGTGNSVSVTGDSTVARGTGFSGSGN